MMWLQGAAEGAQPEGLADDERVERDQKTSGYFFDCTSISSNWSTIISANCRPVWRRKTRLGEIVELDRVGHRQDRPGARPHPDRLVVERPVHQ